MPRFVAACIAVMLSVLSRAVAAQTPDETTAVPNAATPTDAATATSPSADPAPPAATPDIGSTTPAVEIAAPPQTSATQPVVPATAPATAPATRNETWAPLRKKSADRPMFKHPKAEQPVPAQAPDEDWGRYRMLSGHYFPQPQFVPSAFTASSVGVRVGVEYHRVPGFSTPLLSFGAAPQAVDLSTLSVAEAIDVTIGLANFIAVFGDVYGRARIGANIDALLGSGADYSYGGDAGALLKLLHIGPFQLAVRARLGYYAGQSAGILTLFHDLNTIAYGTVLQAVNNPMLDLTSAADLLNSAFRSATRDLLTPFDGFSYGASVNGALALGHIIGLQASVGLLLERATFRPNMYSIDAGEAVSFEQVTNTTRVNLALAADLDFDAVGVPLDVIVEYSVTPITTTSSVSSMSQSESSAEHLIAVGASYSGRSDLQLGLTAYSLLGQLPAIGANDEHSGKPLDLGLQFVFRYFW